MKSQLQRLITVTFLASALSGGASFLGGEVATAKTLTQSPGRYQTVTSLYPQSKQLLATRRGTASWYGYRFHGRRTASGERFNASAYTAAHRSLPFGTKVRVTNLRNGRSVIVRINDRGPYARGRVIDLSKAAANAIGIISSGTAPVRIEIVGR
jgi:rare lipoprotein A